YFLIFNCVVIDAAGMRQTKNIRDVKVSAINNAVITESQQSVSKRPAKRAQFRCSPHRCKYLDHVCGMEMQTTNV
ncbi:MAG: hypothetical protein ACKPKO_31080, partial [Candidatus Fonsibacter sp.]